MSARLTNASRTLAAVARRAVRPAGPASRVALLATAVAVASVAVPSAAGATATPHGVIVTLRPSSGPTASYFRLAAAPGRTVTAGALELSNPGSTELAVRVDGVDGQTTNTLGSAYALPDTAAHRSTLWTRVGTHRVVLAPHSTRSVTVVVHVPSRVGPGDYLSGISVEAVGQSVHTPAKNGLAIESISRYAIGVEVTLPGPRRPLLELTGATVEREPGALAFLLLARNAGNVILQDVTGWARITRDGRPVAKVAVGPGTFVTHTAIAYPVLAPRETPSEGTVYHVTAQLRYAGRVTRLSRDVTFGHRQAVTQQQYGGPAPGHPTPVWLWAAIAAVALAALAAVLTRARRRRRRPLGPAATLELLGRLLPGASEQRPLSVVLVATSPPLRDVAPVARALRTRLREGDPVCDLADEGLLVVMPDAGNHVATALALDVGQHLGSLDQLADRAMAIGSATAIRPQSPDRLIARACLDAAERLRARAPREAVAALDD